MMKKLFLLVFVFAILFSSENVIGQKKKAPAAKGTPDQSKQIETLMKLNNNEILVAKMKTSMGMVELQLYPKETPLTVKNFVGLGLQGFYNKLTFHRVVKGFVVQGGDKNGDGSGTTSIYNGKGFANEIVKKFRHDAAGILSMAHSRMPNSNGSQFFITLAPTPQLDGDYTIFGKVIKGLEVVMAMGKVQVEIGDKPVKPIYIESLTFEKRNK